MKNLKSYIAAVIMVMIFCTNNIMAQATEKNNIPAAVVAAFAARYPKAEVKKWDVTNDEYTAKAKENSHKYYVTFNKNGNWIKTTSRFNWPGHLSAEVQNAFKKSDYGSWHIFGINIVETPSGEFYQVMIDNTNHPVDALHQGVLTENRLLEFKSNGEFIKEKNINENPMI